MKKLKAFTLIETVVAVTVFMLILGVGLNAYINIIKSQNKSNLNRAAISELIQIIQVIEQENNFKSFNYENPTPEIFSLISNDGLEKTTFSFNEPEKSFEQSLQKRTNISEDFKPAVKQKMHSSKLEFNKVSFTLTPGFNPYNANNINQFADETTHPKVDIEFNVVNPNQSGKTFDFNFTLSSRSYQNPK